MKTQTLTLQAAASRTDAKALRTAFQAIGFAPSFARWLLAGAVATAVLIGAIWAATTPSVDQYLAAGVWGAGFLFFALALEVGVKRVLPYIVTGISLPALAVLGTELAAEFSMVAGAVVAGWLALWIVRRA